MGKTNWTQIALILGVLVVGFVLIGGKLPFSIVSESVVVGQTYQKSFTLNFAAPRTNYSAGVVDQYDCTTYIANQAGTVLQQFSQKSTFSATDRNYTGSISWTPSTAGGYIAGALCVKRTATYNAATQQWSAWSSATELAKDSVRVDAVLTQPPNPPPIDWLSQIFNSIKAWLCQNFGVFC